MSTTEEKSPDSADAPSKKEDEQQAVAAGAEAAKESGDEAKDAAAEPSDEAAAAPAAEGAEKSAAEAAPAEPDEETDELDIEVEPTEEPPAAVDPVAELEERVVSLEAAKKNNYDRLLRAMADLENFRKRSRRDVKDARLDERGKILRDMLPVIDNLERAVDHAEQSDNEATKSIVEGVNLVLRQFKQALERHQVTPLDAVGKTFDPAVHEAVSQAPSAEHPPGTILSTLQSGYMMDGRLLRPSLVVVSIAAPAEEKAEDKPAEPKAEAGAAAVIDAESTEVAAVADDAVAADAVAPDKAADSAEDAAEESTDDAEAADAPEASDEASEDVAAPDEKKDAPEDKA
jgi:molecular chaperone GrpE